MIGSDDPTSRAAGRGPGMLRDEGVASLAELADRRRPVLNQPFRKALSDQPAS